MDFYGDLIIVELMQLGKEKMRRQRESIELKENFQNEILTTTQQHMDREIELQDFCQREKDAHLKTIEVYKTLYRITFCTSFCSSKNFVDLVLIYFTLSSIKKSNLLKF